MSDNPTEVKFNPREESHIRQLVANMVNGNSYDLYQNGSELRKIGKPAIPALLKIVNEDDSSAGGWAASVLGSINDNSIIEPLLEALEKGKYWATWGLASFGSKPVPQLISLLSHPDRHVRYYIASTLGQIGDSEAVESLVNLLQDIDPQVRRTTAYALQDIGDRRAIEPLTLALSDEDDFVRKISLAVLEDFYYTELRSARENPPSKGLILLVFNYGSDRVSYSKKVEAAGYEAITARETQTVLSQLANLQEVRGKVPDLIMGDYALWEDDEARLVKELKANPLYRNIPLVFVIGSYYPPEYSPYLDLIIGGISEEQLAAKLPIWISSAVQKD
ncbi:MAG TPA: HEAT repeat domain-containing protein [Chloroflexia bacterium]|nr:HEAT repeat domain-containing protein [Chloroflexia bacterium]